MGACSFLLPGSELDTLHIHYLYFQRFVKEVKPGEGLKGLSRFEGEKVEELLRTRAKIDRAPLRMLSMDRLQGGP